MKPHRTVSVIILGFVLTFLLSWGEAHALDKRAVEQAENPELQLELTRVKRVDDNPQISSAELSRVKRIDLDVNPGLSRVKRQQYDADPGLSRVKRREFFVNPGLSRVKRRELDVDPSLSRVKRDDVDEQLELSREKRRNNKNVPRLPRAKRYGKDIHSDSALSREKRQDTTSESMLERLKRSKSTRGNKDSRKSQYTGEKTEAAETRRNAEMKQEKIRTKKDKNISGSQKVMVKKKAKRKRGWWEKRSRRNFFLKHSNKRNKGVKRGYTGGRKRGLLRNRKSDPFIIMKKRTKSGHFEGRKRHNDVADDEGDIEAQRGLRMTDKRHMKAVHHLKTTNQLVKEAKRSNKKYNTSVD